MDRAGRADCATAAEGPVKLPSRIGRSAGCAQCVAAHRSEADKRTSELNSPSSRIRIRILTRRSEIQPVGENPHCHRRLPARCPNSPALPRGSPTSTETITPMMEYPVTHPVRLGSGEKHHTSIGDNAAARRQGRAERSSRAQLFVRCLPWMRSSSKSMPGFLDPGQPAAGIGGLVSCHSGYIPRSWHR